MKTSLAALAVALLLPLAPPAGAQIQPPPGSPSPGMVSTPQPAFPNPTADEAAAKTKLEGMGYGEIKGLGANGDGSWTGKALRDGSEVTVTIDSHGNVRQR